MLHNNNVMRQHAIAMMNPSGKTSLITNNTTAPVAKVTPRTRRSCSYYESAARMG